MSPSFEILGLDCAADERTIKRAYAKLIKEYRPDAYPAEFARIREAYENALEDFRHQAYWAQYNESSSDVDNAEPFAEEEAAHAELSFTKVEVPTQATEAALASGETQDEIANLSPENALEAHHQVEWSYSLDSLHQGLAPETQSTNALQDEEAGSSQDSWILDGYHVIQQMIQALTQFELPRQENDAKDCFYRHMQQISQMPLDARMDYEDALAQWLLFSEQPSLQVFEAASQQFGWHVDHLSSIHRYASSARRFTELQELFASYTINLEATNLFYANDANTLLERLYGKARQDFLNLKQQYASWGDRCRQIDLPRLQNYFSVLPEKAFQLYAVDLIFGFMVGTIAWLILVLQLRLEALHWFPMVLLYLGAFVVSTYLPPTIRYLDRRLANTSHQRLSRRYLKIKNASPIAYYLFTFLVMVLLAVVMPKSVIFSAWVVVVFYLLAPMLGLYWVATKLEPVLMGVWRFLLDAMVEVEVIVAKQEKPFKSLIRVALYLGLPFLMLKLLLPVLTSWLQLVFKSTTMRALLKAVGVFAVILGYIIADDYNKQQRLIKQHEAERTILRSKIGN